MDIEFDPEKAEESLRKHGVSFAHAEQALRDPNGVTIEDPDAQGEARCLISARRASKSEAREYAKGI